MHACEVSDTGSVLTVSILTHMHTDSPRQVRAGGSTGKFSRGASSIREGCEEDIGAGGGRRAAGDERETEREARWSEKRRLKVKQESLHGTPIRNAHADDAAERKRSFVSLDPNASKSLSIPFLKYASMIGFYTLFSSTPFTFRGGGWRRTRIRLLNHGHPEEGLLLRVPLLQQESLQGIACSASADWN